MSTDGFFASKKNLRCLPIDIEAVVRGFSAAPALYPILVDNLSVGLGEALLVMNVPPQCVFEQGIDEADAYLGLAEVPVLVAVDVRAELLNQPVDLRGNSHRSP
jgi:hypothetical protein